MLRYGKFCGKVKILLLTKRLLRSLSAAAFPKAVAAFPKAVAAFPMAVTAIMMSSNSL